MRPAAFLLSALLLAACQTAGEEEAPATAQAPDSITPESEIYVPGTSDVGGVFSRLAPQRRVHRSHAE
jgi:ABC-type oligopeptide transport system substrate-binding subunit